MKPKDNLNRESIEPKLGYGPTSAIIVTLGIYIISQIVVGLAFGLVPALFHKTPSEINHLLDTSVAVQFFTVFILEAITVLLLLWFLNRRRTSIKQLGVDHPRLYYLALAATGFVGYFILYIVGLSLATHFIPSLNVKQQQDIGFNTATHGLNLALVFISLVILPPLVEELVMRGFLYTGLRTKLPVITATLITSLLFAGAHLPEGRGGLLWVGAIDTFILSVVLCYLREKTGSLWPSIGVHMLKNALAFVVLFNVVGYFR